MKVFLGLFSLYATLYAYSYTELLKDYEAKNFEKVCSQGSIFLTKNDKNETSSVLR